MMRAPATRSFQRGAILNAPATVFRRWLGFMPRKGGEQLTPLVNHFVNGASLVKSSVVGFTNKVMQKTPYEGLQTFLRRTYAALSDGTEPPVTFEDMDRASLLVDALLDEKNRV